MLDTEDYMEDKKPVKQVKFISNLHMKFAKRPWSDTFHLVRQCMDKPSVGTQPCKPLTRCLEKLLEALKVSSLSAMVSRLEIIAKGTGMGSHFTENTCYLTSDLFYLEVALQPEGEVEDVKVAQYGEAPVLSESLLHLLRSRKFEEFSVRLADLYSLHNIPVDNETKMKLFTSLRHLEKDLQKISYLPRALREYDPRLDAVLNGRVGYLTRGIEGRPMTIQFYVNASDAQKLSGPGSLEGGAVSQVAKVVVGTSVSPYNLQMASLLPQPPQIDSQGGPVFRPLVEIPHESLPAYFLLQLQPPLPMLSSFVNRINQITDLAIPDVDLQGASFPRLLMGGSVGVKSCKEASADQDNIFTVRLSDEMAHHYVFPGAFWEAAALRGALVGSVPFTHPCHVPALLAVLRHQCAINTLLSSCATAPPGSLGSVANLHHEVLPESDTSFSLTFQRPDQEALAVLLLDVPEFGQLTCRLFAAGFGVPSIDEDVTRVMKRSMSIPVTMGVLWDKMAEKMNIPHPSPACQTLSPVHMLRINKQNNNPPVTSPTVTSQHATGHEASPAPACVSLPVSENNTARPAHLYPRATASVFSPWVVNGHLPQLV